jgi:hypothetical protein
MSRHTVLLVVAAIAIGAAPAWAQLVQTDHDPSATFATVKTYNWAKTDPSQNDLTNQRLVAAVDAWLTAKGWTKVPDADADVAVVPVVMTQEGKVLTLVLDLYDARTKTLMWREMFQENFRFGVTHTA